MTGVNDAKNVAFWQGEGACIDHDLEAADAMQELARAAWRPVSEPPTEADGADATPVGAIAVKTSDGCIAMPVEWSAVANGECPSVVSWARIKDVVLLPQSTGDEA